MKEKEKIRELENEEEEEEEKPEEENERKNLEEHPWKKRERISRIWKECTLREVRKNQIKNTQEITHSSLFQWL
jgi:hypothetical protein